MRNLSPPRRVSFQVDFHWLERTFEITEKQCEEESEGSVCVLFGSKKPLLSLFVSRVSKEERRTSSAPWNLEIKGQRRNLYALHSSRPAHKKKKKPQFKTRTFSEPTQTSLLYLLIYETPIIHSTLPNKNGTNNQQPTQKRKQSSNRLLAWLWLNLLLPSSYGQLPIQYKLNPLKTLVVSLTRGSNLRGFFNLSFGANLLLDPPYHTMEILGDRLSAQAGDGDPLNVDACQYIIL